MGWRIDRAARRELIRAVRERYQEECATQKGRILDEFVEVTGYHRKHAIRLLTGRAELRPPTGGAGRPRLYDDAVREALIVLWEASDRICGRRLRALLPTLIRALEHHGHLALAPPIKEKLMAASAATLDRLLAQARASVRAVTKPRPRAKPKVQRAVPIRTFDDWKDPEPGFVEIDLVEHCGETMAGTHVHTLVLTDICSGWTECAALAVREASLIVDALEVLQRSLPFPLRGIDVDNGTEFLNEALFSYCAAHSIVTCPPEIGPPKMRVLHATNREGELRCARAGSAKSRSSRS